MESIIINLVEKLNAMQERALEAEYNVKILKESVVSATEKLAEATNAIADQNNTIAELEDKLKSRDSTINFYYKRCEKFEAELKALKKEDADGEV